MKQSDDDLIAEVATGDVRAFEHLYRRYQRPVAGLLFKLVGRPSVVDELVNDVMLVVWRKADSFAGRSKVSTWIMGIGYNTALKAVRKLGRLPTTVAIDVDVPDDDPGPTGYVAQGERRRRIQHALDELTPQHRAVVELTFYLGHTYGEIAEIMQCPENTVKTRMFHARKRLRQLLHDNRPSRAGGKAST